MFVLCQLPVFVYSLYCRVCLVIEYVVMVPRGVIRKFEWEIQFVKLNCGKTDNQGTLPWRGSHVSNIPINHFKYHPPPLETLINCKYIIYNQFIINNKIKTFVLSMEV